MGWSYPPFATGTRATIEHLQFSIQAAFIILFPCLYVVLRTAQRGLSRSPSRIGFSWEA